MPDAEEVEFPRASLPRAEPRHPEVWIRIGGRWRPGRIVKWVNVPGAGWVVWSSWRGERPASEHAWLRFDEAAIRPRDGDEPPQ